MHSTAASVPPSVRLLFTERDRRGAYSTDRRRKTAGGRRRGGCCKSSFWRGKGAGCCIIVPPYRPTFGGTEAEETLEGGGKKSREPPSLPPSLRVSFLLLPTTNERTDGRPATNFSAPIVAAAVHIRSLDSSDRLRRGDPPPPQPSSHFPGKGDRSKTENPAFTKSLPGAPWAHPGEGGADRKLFLSLVRCGHGNICTN